MDSWTVGTTMGCCKQARCEAPKVSGVRRRMRKDPLDPIDTGTKVALGVQRIFNPRKAQEEAARRKAAAEEAAAAAKANKKKGTWGGLP